MNEKIIDNKTETKEQKINKKALLLEQESRSAETESDPKKKEEIFARVEDLEKELNGLENGELTDNLMEQYDQLTKQMAEKGIAKLLQEMNLNEEEENQIVTEIAQGKFGNFLEIVRKKLSPEKIKRAVSFVVIAGVVGMLTVGQAKASNINLDLGRILSGKGDAYISFPVDDTRVNLNVPLSYGRKGNQEVHKSRAEELRDSEALLWETKDFYRAALKYYENEINNDNFRTTVDLHRKYKNITLRISKGTKIGEIKKKLAETADEYTRIEKLIEREMNSHR